MPVKDALEKANIELGEAIRADKGCICAYAVVALPEEDEAQEGQVGSDRMSKLNVVGPVRSGEVKPILSLKGEAALVDVTDLVPSWHKELFPRDVLMSLAIVKDLASDERIQRKSMSLLQVFELFLVENLNVFKAGGRDHVPFTMAVTNGQKTAFSSLQLQLKEDGLGRVIIGLQGPSARRQLNLNKNAISHLMPV